MFLLSVLLVRSVFFSCFEAIMVLREVISCFGCRTICNYDSLMDLCNISLCLLAIVSI